MGCTNPFNEIHDATLYKVEQGTFELDELQYHASWDWLMPVVHKIKGTSAQGIFMMEIGLPIEHVYNAVVEFIKEYNRTTDYNKVTYYDGQ